MSDGTKGNYEVLIGFCIGSGVDVYPGDVVELTEKEAVSFVRAGRIRLSEDRDPSVANREVKRATPKPARPPKITRAAAK